MKVELTNLGKVAVPAVSTEDKGYAFELKPDTPQVIDTATVTVLTIGHNPSFKEDVIDALENIGALVKRLITFWREHAKTGADEKPIVRVHVANMHTTHGLRVRLGDGANEVEIDPETSWECEAPEYLELREMGIAPQQAGQEAP